MFVALMRLLSVLEEFFGGISGLWLALVGALDDRAQCFEDAQQCTRIRRFDETNKYVCGATDGGFEGEVFPLKYRLA
jgi:hypothetical protein